MKLIDATNDSYADQLREGTVKVAPRDLATLFRLCTEVLENSETNVCRAERTNRDLHPAEESERKLQVLQALRNAGVLKHFLDLDQENSATPTEAPNVSDGCNVLDEQMVSTKMSLIKSRWRDGDSFNARAGCHRRAVCARRAAEAAVCPLSPTSQQEAFLLLPHFEVFYGGAAAGGKSVALLMAALKYVDVPGYHGLIVRKSFAELALPGNLIDLSHQWLDGTKASWSDEQKQWRFPGRGRTGSGGATLTFGYLADDGDVNRYAGTSFSYLAFEELSRFSETHYMRMRRVLRQPTGREMGEPAPMACGSPMSQSVSAPLPTQVVCTTNGSRAFVEPTTELPTLFFTLPPINNPHIDYESYVARLAGLPPAERARLQTVTGMSRTTANSFSATGS